jgi:RND family efflux transporter MFP subunit
MNRLRIGAVVIGAVLAAGAWVVVSRRGPQDAETKAAFYHCPMHVGYTSDRPGTCPICGMNLVPTTAGGATKGSTGSGREVAFYRSPMDPSVRSDKPAKDSMGMDFIPVYKDELGASGSEVPGRVAITISPERRQVLGIRSAAVTKGRIVHRIRTVGTVSVDERRLRHIHTKYDGYVEHLYVDYTGKLVRRGEPLLAIYSPELVATQQEYLLAYRARARMAESSVRTAAQGSADLLEAARQRLILWDIRTEDIEKLEKAGQVMRTLDVYADISGYVVQKMAFHGMRVTPADTLYDIADLSHLWVLADVYEYNLPAVTLGTQGRIQVASMPGRAWRGKVTYISPTVEEKTRTIKVRLEVDNVAGELKPDMYADVFLEADLGVGIVVPDGAVINAGDRRLVFLDRGEGRFEPREIRLGVKVNDAGLQVVSGLADGDRVVTSANFLLDSESSLKAALAGMLPVDPEAPAKSSAQPAHQH